MARMLWLRPAAVVLVGGPSRCFCCLEDEGDLGISLLRPEAGRLLNNAHDVAGAPFRGSNQLYLMMKADFVDV